jgi:hypothetical protein
MAMCIKYSSNIRSRDEIKVKIAQLDLGYLGVLE